MEKLASIKLATNIPLRGRITWCGWYAASKEGWKDQICLIGEWDDVGKGKLYLTDFHAERLAELGVVKKTDGVGQARWTVVDSQKVVTILKTEDGTRKTITIEAGAPTTGQSPRVEGPDSPTAPADRQHFIVLRDTYQACLAMTMQAWQREGFKDVPLEVLQAGTATMLIAAQREGWWVKK